MNMPCERHNPRTSGVLLFLLLLTAVEFGCGNGSSGIGNDTPESNRQPGQWEKFDVAAVDEVGTSLPYATAHPDAGGNIHIAYYNAVTPAGGNSYHQLNHLVWRPGSGVLSNTVVENTPAPSDVDGFDRCAQFDFVLAPDDTPVFIYPVEEVVVPLAQIEADIMINAGGGLFSEYTGAIGFVERNPVYYDGHATSNMSVAVDSGGGIHIAYQFFTEGMDSANYRYPDLFYVCRSPESLDEALSPQAFGAIEEAVDGNTFSTYGVHNSVGYHCRLVLDAEERPVIVYAEHPESYYGTYALKIAARDDTGGWHHEIVETLEYGWKVGAISAAFYPDGALAIAYALKAPDPAPDNGHRLKHATNRSGEWVAEIVDEVTWCGDYCAIAVNSEGTPGIAYFDEQSHSDRPHRFLKYTEFDGLRWVRETVDEYEEAGRFNSLWFDAADVPLICSYSDVDHEIVVFRRMDEN